MAGKTLLDAIGGPNEPLLADTLTANAVVLGDKVYSGVEGTIYSPVLARQTTPPGSPTTGDMYIVQAAGTGEWAGHDDEIAKFDGADWVFSVCVNGDLALLPSAVWRYNTTWEDASSLFGSSAVSLTEIDSTPGAEYEWASLNPKVNGAAASLLRVYHLGFAGVNGTLLTGGEVDNTDLLIVTPAAPHDIDLNGSPLLLIGGDAGTDDAGTGGNNGGQVVVTSGLATDAKAGSGLAGGDSGDVWIGAASAGAGDGAGVSGSVGTTNLGKAPLLTLGVGTEDTISPVKIWHQVRYVVQPVAAATDTVDDDAVIVHVTYTGTGAVTNLELPTAGMVAGRVLHIKDAGGLAGTNNITVTTEGAETIDGAAQYIMNNNYEAINLYTDGSNWFVF